MNWHWALMAQKRVGLEGYAFWGLENLTTDDAWPTPTTDMHAWHHYWRFKRCCIFPASEVRSSSKWIPLSLNPTTVMNIEDDESDSLMQTNLFPFMLYWHFPFPEHPRCEHWNQHADLKSSTPLCKCCRDIPFSEMMWFDTTKDKHMSEQVSACRRRDQSCLIHTHYQHRNRVHVQGWLFSGTCVCEGSYLGKSEKFVLPLLPFHDDYYD